MPQTHQELLEGRIGSFERLAFSASTPERRKHYDKLLEQARTELSELLDKADPSREEKRREREFRIQCADARALGCVHDYAEFCADNDGSDEALADAYHHGAKTQIMEELKLDPFTAEMVLNQVITDWRW